VEHLKHYEHVHVEDIGMISQLIGFFKKTCRGNGRLLLKIFGGNITELSQRLLSKSSGTRTM